MCDFATLRHGVAIMALSSGLAAATHAAPIFIEKPYVKAADSICCGATIEDFEDQLLDIPGVTASAGFVPVPDPNTSDSVDEDDGSIDGSGSAGSALYANGETTLTFSFDATVLGSLPTRAGVVLTDIGSGGLFDGPVTFEAFGPGGASLDTYDSFFVGDGGDAGGTAEDRFFGVVDDGGISAISITTDNGDWEVDHVQYAFVPEPSTLLSVGLGLALLGRRRRK